MNLSQAQEFWLAIIVMAVGVANFLNMLFTALTQNEHMLNVYANVGIGSNISFVIVAIVSLCIGIIAFIISRR